MASSKVDYWVAYLVHLRVEEKVVKLVGWLVAYLVVTKAELLAESKDLWSVDKRVV